jgi:hypothetical protein
MNHLWSQRNGFVMGDKNTAKGVDLVDAAVYCASVAYLEQPIG